jgi:cytochrome P450
VRLPPGASSSLVSTLQFLHDPFGSLERAARRYGDPFTIRTPVGRAVVTGDPEGVRQIFGADPLTFEAFGVDLLGPVIGEKSLLLLSGEPHRASRKLQAPPFHGARMRAYAEAMRTVALDEAARWQPGQPFVMQQSTQAISLRVILRTVFGLVEPAKMQRFERAVIEVIDALKPTFLFMPSLRTRLFPPWRRFERATQAIEQLVYAELAERRAGGGGEDILSMLLSARYDDGSQMEDRELFEQLMTLVIAGHETTAISLAWAFHLVHTHRAVHERLSDELRAAGDDADALTKLPYLEAVCHETLRLMPLTVNVLRKVKRPFTLKGWEVPPGLGVGASILLVHRNPAVYPEPEVFRPERFLERTFAPHEFLPFGGGARRCLGAAFATYEMKVVLGTLLRAHVMRSAETKPVKVVVRNTVMGPGSGVRMVLDERRAPARASA